MAIAAVQINTLVVHLPDLHQCVANRLAAAIEHPPAQVRDRSQRGGDAVINDDEIVVSVQRKVVGVKRTFGLLRRANQFLSKSAWNGEEGRSEAQAAEEAPPILK